MTQKLKEVSIPMPGGQGLSSELTPFQPQSEFALRADNAVVDRVGRLASREAFADYVMENDFKLDYGIGFDIVRMESIDREDRAVNAIPGDLTEYAGGEYNLAEYGGLNIQEPEEPDEGVGAFTYYEDGAYVDSYWGDAEFKNAQYSGKSNLWAQEEVYGIASVGPRIEANSEYGLSEFSEGSFKGNFGIGVYPESYIGFTLDGRKLRQMKNVNPKNGMYNSTLVPFKDSVFFFSKQEEAMCFNKGTAIKMSDHPDWSPPRDDNGIIAYTINGEIACAAYGRLWVSGINNNYDTIYYSDLLIPFQWYDGTTDETGNPEDAANSAGIIDVREYWPDGNDKIQGMSAHNGFLFVFGKRSILIYSGADGDPAGNAETGSPGLKLEDAIRDVGLVNQDAMCNIGSDHLFVDSLGVRALGRVIQEKSTPLQEPSLNISTVIREKIDSNLDSVRLRHMPGKNLAVCLFPKDLDAFVFRLGQPSASGGLKVTRWDGCDFFDVVSVKTTGESITLLGGMSSRGILSYSGYDQPKPYVFRYESAALAGSSLTQTMIPKTMTYAFASDEPSDVIASWGFDGDITYQRKAKEKTKSSWSGGLRTSRASLNGSGTTMRVGFSVDINGVDISMQQISVNVMTGRSVI